MRPPGENPETSVQSLTDELLHPQRPAVWHRTLLCFILIMMSTDDYDSVSFSASAMSTFTAASISLPRRFLCLMTPLWSRM